MSRHQADDAIACYGFRATVRFSRAVGRRYSVTVLVVVLRTHGGVSRAARDSGAVERHALDAAAEKLRLLRREGAGVDAHPGDLRRKPAVLDLRSAVHHHLEAVRLREVGRLVVADAELHPDHLRMRLERERLLDDPDRV